MYNQDRKERFITFKMERAKFDEYYIKNVFEKTEPFEEELNKDVCNFITNEINNMYKTLNFSSSNSLLAFNSLLSTYTAWCFTNGFVDDGQNHYEEFNYERLIKLLNKFVMSARVVDRNQVLDWCSELPNIEDKFLLLGLFEGVGGKEYIDFTELERDDVDIDNCVIDLPSRGKTKFSKQLCDFAIDASEETEYQSLTSERPAIIIPSNKIIKDFANTKETADQFRKGRRIYGRIKRIFSYIGIDRYMKPMSIADSGMIYYINEMAAKDGVNARQWMKDHVDDIYRQFNRSIDHNRFYSQYKDFLA